MSEEENGEVVRRFVEEVANGRNLGEMDELLSDDFALPPGTEGALDREGLKAVLQYYFSAFPDLHYTIEDMIVDGDRVVTRLTMSGTHRRGLRRRAGVGQAVRSRGGRPHQPS
jgi:predicted ester cyclase